MGKSKATANFAITKMVDRFADAKTLQKIGETAIEGIRRTTASGQSPVRGEGRYEQYSDSYKAQIQKGQIQGKATRPVNLRKSGRMMEDLEYRRTSKSVKVGWFSGPEKTIAEYHNDGTPKMPKRQLIPGDNQEFTVGIQDDIKEVYAANISDIIDRSNSR